jgi:hypothetical protein
VKKLALVLLALNLGFGAFFIGREQLAGTLDMEDNAPIEIGRMSLRSLGASRPTDGAVAGQDEPYCVEWRGLTPPEFARAREQLKGVVSERVMSFTEVPLNTRYWVVFPPLPSVESARLKLSEFAAAGLQDATVVSAGDWQNAISFGLYGSEELARRRVRDIEGSGVLGTRIEQQPVQGTDFYFVIRSADREALKNLNELKAGYPNSQLSRVACQAS